MANVRIEETREKIVSVANSLFSRFGFRKTSMDEIARTSRRAKGSLYYHFSSKEDLFREVVKNEIEEIKSSLKAVTEREDLDPAEKLMKYMLVRMETMNNAPNYHEIIQQDEYGQFEFMADLKKDLKKWEKERITRIIQGGLDKGEFDLDLEAGILAEMVVMITGGLENSFYLEGKYEEYQPHFHGMAKILLKGMRH